MKSTRSHLLTIAVARSRIVEITSAAVLFAWLGFEIARNL
jgi:hypothetical protein